MLIIWTESGSAVGKLVRRPNAMELRRAFHISRQYASSNLLSQLVNSVHDVWLRTPHFKDLEKFLTVRAFPSNRRRVQGLGADSTERMVGELMEVGVELTTKIEKKRTCLE